MKVLVTGAWGFLGHHLQGALYDAPWPKELMLPTHAQLELLDLCETVKYFGAKTPDIVIHLAATVGGIGANQARPADFWYENTVMGAHVLRACVASEVKRLVLVGTTCSYPRSPKRVPFEEPDLFDGYPEKTNAPYGIAKRSVIAGAYAFQSQYGLAVDCVIPTNLYGPHDHFDLETSHVIPALIRKFDDAKRAGASSVTLWGTGQPTRDFLFARDAADAIVALVGKGPPAKTWLNIGSGVEVSIRELAEAVRDTVGYNGAITWDATKPDGQPRRALWTAWLRERIDWEPKVTLAEGLRQTYAWYLGQRR